jgi:hypothetical protein
MVTRARERRNAVGSSLTRRVTIAWHERAREFMGETPMPLSNTPSHNSLNQRAGKRENAVGTSLTGAGCQAAAKKGTIQKFTA